MKRVKNDSLDYSIDSFSSVSPFIQTLFMSSVWTWWEKNKWNVACFDMWNVLLMFVTWDPFLLNKYKCSPNTNLERTFSKRWQKVFCKTNPRRTRSLMLHEHSVLAGMSDFTGYFFLVCLLECISMSVLIKTCDSQLHCCQIGCYKKSFITFWPIRIENIAVV